MISTKPFCMPWLHYSEHYRLMLIENLVSQVIYIKQQFSINGSVAFNLNREIYQALQHNLPLYLSVYEPACDYSEHLNAFWYGCQHSGLIAWWQNYQESGYSMTLPKPDDLYCLIDHIAKYSSFSEFTLLAQRRYQQCLENRQKLEQGINNLIDHYSKTLFVRADLYYYLNDRPYITCHDFIQETNQLFDRLSYRRGPFNALKGRAWCREQGNDCGIHTHLLLGFNGHTRQSGWFIAKALNDVWRDITGGTGFSYNCHVDESLHEEHGRRGIGTIHRDRSHDRMNAIRVGSYLAEPLKTDQYLRKKPKGTRAFGQHFDF